MSVKFIFSKVLLLAFISVNAQSEFSSSYEIRNSNDTLKQVEKQILSMQGGG